jgi:pyruvate dehydrogenase E1 component alpha subunit
VTDRPRDGEQVLSPAADGVYQVLDPEGNLHAGVTPALDDEFVLEALRWMTLSRVYDQKAIGLQRQGRYGIVSPVLGQEASVVGAAMAFDPTVDWLVPSYRELPAYLMWGLPLSHHMLNLTGNPIAGRIPDGVKMLPTQASIASQLQHAVGLAWGLQIQNKDGIVLTFCGDGASSEGDFHEACNLAGVVGAPMVILLQNNQWAISTPRAYQSAAPHLSDRAAGYGIAGSTVDGNDLLAVYEVTKAAAERARSGGGTTLIESVTYRMSFHNTTDQPSRYQDPAQLKEAGQRDPLKRLHAYLTGRGLWNAEREREYSAAAELAFSDAMVDAESAAAKHSGQIFDNVFAELTPRLEKQRRELLGQE